ncbi:GNAT family N-acetyltransferase [Candidatus Xianfuyuplasma coldseepsis]|uniref:GNAT family N-acetyltransferase n=1 Tax=Candidatus Xianfuyuplasma coldseepsis TaxID=2782163 RepID=A0A7L7KRB6_9MOLU|nr:GNAT family N-acetyltransferase [Xianfuyuplasma coldseepsis]QMS85371.1 GNAT family N-acetyltransferase [Xianfuyuplasma coldseepsis]
MITLVQPHKDLEQEIFDYKAEMIEAGDTELSGCGSLDKYDDYDHWIRHIKTYSNKDTLPEGYVEGSQWVLVDTARNRVLGFVNIRHYLNDFLRNYGGHIGYSIRPSERRKGYAKLQLQLALHHLQSLGVQKALVTCDVANIGSYKTIEACGGVLEDIVYSKEHGHTKRYWITLKK